MIYPKNFEQKIGFDVVRNEINKRCVSPLGLTYAERMLYSEMAIAMGWTMDEAAAELSECLG